MWNRQRDKTMIEIKRENGAPVKVFAKTFEYEAYDQVKALANYEAYKDSTIRIMPDAHAGKGCTIGTTMTINDKVTPNLVGVDIGCGMLVIELGKIDPDFEKLDSAIRELIPSGFNIHPQPIESFIQLDNLKCAKQVDLNRAACSLGSLGGGNHFIELNVNEDIGEYYLVIHSGSRHLGVQVCNYYQNLAYTRLNEMSTIKNELIRVLKAQGREKEIQTELKKIKKPSCNKELAHLEGDAFTDYLHDMSIVQKYASTNRRLMAELITGAMMWRWKYSFETIHNYIDLDAMILRKGAVRAMKGERLIIPMNMRDGSLICVGKGNEDWNYSAPHGAGRLMSRAKAKESLSLDEFKSTMSGIYTTTVGTGTIDESPMAYKPMDEIIECITPTVDIIKIIKPVYNFKASE